MRSFNWLLVALAAPLLLFTSPAQPWVLALVPLILLIQALAGRRTLPLTSFNPTLLLLALALLGSLYATTDLADSFAKIAGLLFGLLVFFTVLRDGQSTRAWQLALLLFCLLGLAIAAAGLVSTRWAIDKIPVINTLTALLPQRLAGLQGAAEGLHPNEVAGALLWVLPVMTGAALARWTAVIRGAHLARRWFWAAAFALAALFTLGVLFLTQSRGAYLGLACAILLSVILACPPRIRCIGLGLLFLAILLVVVLLSVMGWQLVSDLVFGSAASAPTGQNLIDSLALREQIWSRAVWGIKDFGLLGMGLNRFRTIFHQLYPSFLIPVDLDIAHAHNELLQAGVELGYLGLIAFLSLNLTAAAMLWQILLRADRAGKAGQSLRWQALGLGAAWLAHFIYGLTDAIALGARPGFLFWFLLALISGLHHLSSEKPSALM